MLTTDPKLRVLEALQTREGMTAMQLAGRTMLPPSLAGQVLSSLLQADVVRSKSDKKGLLRYFLTYRGKHVRESGTVLAGPS